MDLIPVNPDSDQHCTDLYEILRLRLREPHHNISHRSLPDYAEHCAFVKSRPYAGWYLAQTQGQTTGATYLTRNDEIGIWVAPSHRGRGYGSEMVRKLMALHPRDSYLANVNPANEDSIRFFTRLGGDLLQFTFRIKA